MSASDWTLAQDGRNFAFRRGFTGHEHYDRFGIINMNARLYDPVIGRFFSPDPQVQNPFSTQGFNRYSYCGNNPVMYTDPNGEFFIIDSWILGFIHGFFSTGNNRWEAAWNTANRIASNDLKLWGGLFITDPNKSFFGQVWEIVSRFTWQAPQTLAGFTLSQFANASEWIGFTNGGIQSIDYLYGATVVTYNVGGWGAVTLGSYINGDNNLKADPNNYLFQHEYGHYIQSQNFGIVYLSRYGIPSGLNCMGHKNHNYHPAEQDANIRAFKYFNKYIDNYTGWKFGVNPIGGYDNSLPYDDSQNQAVLNNGLLRPAWYDYILPGWFAITGIINWLSLENYEEH
jgi:RHS repeat-associated protein